MSTKESKISKEIYNNQAEEYSSHQSKYVPVLDLRKKVHSVLGNVRNKKILFAGCGDGLECFFSIKKGAEVVGIDISENLIELAKKNCPEATFYVKDFENTGFKNKEFDIIVSILAVMYIEDLSSVLREFKRILRDEGIIVLAVPHPLRKMIKYNKLNYFVKGKKWETWKNTKRFNYYRLFEDYFDSFKECTLNTVKLIEPKIPKESNYPHFLVIKLKKQNKT